MARVLDGIHDLRVEITGHTDAVGTDQYNIGLSERRAKAIQNYFKSRGIEPEKLEIDFKGKREPVDTNKTKEGKQRKDRKSNTSELQSRPHLVCRLLLEKKKKENKKHQKKK